MTVINLFLWNARIRIQRNMAYRADFFVGLFVSLVGSSIGPLFQYLLFTNTKGFPGWNLQQIILLQGMVMIFMGMKGMLFGNIGGVVASMVWRGQFDRLLSLPYKPIRSLLASGFDLSQIGVLVAGSFLTVYAWLKLSISVGVWQILLVLIGYMSGLILYLAFMVMYCTIMVMVTKIGSFQEVIDTLFSFISYPAEIFPRALQIVLMTVLPFMVIVYFPAQTLLHRATMTAIPGILVCIGFFAFSLIFWEWKLKKYTSAGG